MVKELHSMLEEDISQESTIEILQKMKKLGIKINFSNSGAEDPALIAALIRLLDSQSTFSQKFINDEKKIELRRKENQERTDLLLRESFQKGLAVIQRSQMKQEDWEAIDQKMRKDYIHKADLQDTKEKQKDKIVNEGSGLARKAEIQLTILEDIIMNFMNPYTRQMLLERISKSCEEENFLKRKQKLESIL